MTLAPEAAVGAEAWVGAEPSPNPRAASGLEAPLEAAPSAIYLHIPFCVSHCPYCDFVVVAGRAARGPANRITPFAEALAGELELRADALDERWGPPGERAALETMYLGGGTPSLLPAPTVARLIDLVRTRYGLAPGAEVTLEANPGVDERGDLAAFREAGVTRLSIGAQSLDVGEIRALGRRHAPGDVAATVREARAAGIASVNIDLLYDVPGQTLHSWSSTLEGALALAPDHLSIYALTLDDPDAEGITAPGGDHLPIRPGARRWRDRARRLQDDDRAAAMYELADARLGAAGFEWYEISNWARPGHRSRHNQAYWHGRAWEAVGPGAHAFDGAVRRWNAARLDAYLAALQPEDGGLPRLPPGDIAEAPGGLGVFAEAAMLALRTSEGVPRGALDQLELGPALTWALDAQLVEPIADRLVLTIRGRLLSNEVFARLL